MGKPGLALFIVGFSVLLLTAFISGVIVGKNIESYPQKIVKSLPNVIMPEADGTSQKVPAKEEKKESASVNEKGGKEGMELTFYETLPTENKKIKKDPAKEVKSGKENRKSEKPVTAERDYLVRIASFKDENKARLLQKKLVAIGYSTVIEEVRLGQNSNWFRVKLKDAVSSQEARKISSSIENKIKVKCMIVKK
jgi:cell division protein FtsN